MLRLLVLDFIGKWRTIVDFKGSGLVFCYNIGRQV